MSKTILVTGSTGRQGGAVIKALQAFDFEILALTRNTSSPSAQKLIGSNPNIKLLQGDLDNASSIFKDAKYVTSNPIWGVFSVQGKVAGPDKSIEETQGKALIDAALSAEVQFFVYSSVDRGGARSSSNPTPVPHWITKHNIEKYLEHQAAGSNMKYTVLRPTAFMEGITDDFQGKAMASAWNTALKDKPMQLVSTKDIGWFAANAFQHPDEFAGRYLSLAGAEITFQQANDIFKAKFGRDMPTTFGVVSHLLLHMVKDISVLFKYLKQEGTGADIEELRRINPDLTDFGSWLDTESPFRSG
ncbi:NAD(P)-binding protein [Melanomma pulvis-pyrius CBS 109.77]|uniref:NAD(P)-binding protein n=1 Tax=Melanomma pulvis-pyrius CBS 109.77 TaxID=1314802 RepID=A0A6A6XN15_9PLEO|nr:NAD(P)-binding protein [Melanomma pulvis-pyrius CBS 109.77]